jgi:anthranilate phosphoribosyltransferase
LGVAHPELAPLMAAALDRLGTRHALVVSGLDGLDEISISGPTTVWELERGSVRSYQIEPEQFGFPVAPLDAVIGGSAVENATLLQDVLTRPEPGPRRDIIALNAGAGLLVCEAVRSLREGVQEAIAVMESGRALEKLEQWRRFSQWQATS